MIINLKNYSYNFEVLEYEASNLKPKLFLSPRLIVSNHDIFRYSDFYQNIDLYGFMSSYNEDYDTDIMCFDRENYLNCFFYLNIPYDISIDKHVILPKEKLLEDKLYYIKSTKVFYEYDLRSTEHASYNRHNDSLLLCYLPIRKISLVEVLRVSKDFYLLILNKNIIGYYLLNSSNYLYNDDGSKYHKADNKDITEVLQIFWNFYTYKNFEMMNNGDLNIKKCLESIYKLAKSKKVYPVIEIINHWFSMNY